MGDSISDSNVSMSKNNRPKPKKKLSDFASTKDKLLTSAGILCGLCYSFKYIVMALAIGEVGNVLTSIAMDKYYDVIINLNKNFTAPRTALDGYHTYSAFQQIFGLHTSIADAVTHAIYEMILITGGSAVGTWLCYFVMTVTMENAAAKQIHRIRIAFVQSLLQQDIQWFDNCQANKFISQTENDFKLYQDGIGFKFSQLFSYVGAYVLPIFYCLIIDWRLALVGYSTAPIFILAYKLTTKVQQIYSSKETKSFAKAGIIAEDVLTGFKTVIGSNGQTPETERYAMSLIKGRRAGIQKALLTSAGHSFFLITLLGTFALTGWFAAYLYRTFPEYSRNSDAVGHLLSIIMLINIGGIRISEIFGLANYVSLALSCGTRVLDIINKTPSFDCDTNSENKHLVSTIENIEFKDIDFHYSNRKNAIVLQKFNLKINKGECVALVGNSGCGKSTVVSLLHRFYDPVEGTIKINGIDIKELNLGWLRDQIGVVSQEPVLFPTTIYENIRYGYSAATQEDIEMAAKMSNAHDFIMGLPQKYQTNVGDRGTQLSGGQKQRIAIARALIRKPQILLLDEATSALDSQSEMIVQQALDNASVGRTSIVIAHRLSTIRNADKIVVINNGEIVESGNHNSLMKEKGLYYGLINVQAEKNNEDKSKKVKTNMDDIVCAVEQKKAKIVPLRQSKSTKFGILTPDFVKLKLRDPNFKESTKRKLTYLQRMTFYRLLTLGGWGPFFMCLGIATGIAQGFAFMGVFAFVMPYVNVIFENHDPHSFKGLNLYLIFILRYGVALVLCDYFMVLFSGLSGTLIAQRLRNKLFYSLMRQEVSWYEKSSSSVGNLCLILSHDIENIKMTLNSHINAIVTVAAQTGTGLAILYNLSWQFGIVTMVFFALAISLTIFLKQSMHKRVLEEAKLMKFSNEVLRDIVMNIRTIRFLHAEDEFTKLYKQSSTIKVSKNKVLQRIFLAVLGATMDNLSQIAVVIIGVISPMMFFRSQIVLLNYFRGWSIAGMANMFGRSISVMPNVTSAIASIQKIFKIIDRIPEMDNFSQEGTQLSSYLPGTIQFDNVSFSYPTRPQITSLNMFDIDIKQHQTVAIVGSSGSGKSTCVQLAARFYDPMKGHVFVCGHPVKSINLESLRQRMAIVQQEPLLFNRSIAENIAYGDLSRKIPMEEIVEAAKIARADDFISALPQGYDTMVGNRGTQISGGQKQRIAIARALIRNPKLLFLDEATSALDSQTDKDVQIALRQHKNDSTIVIIAHRLSTITDADQIFVVHQGRVVERGKHQELMTLNGFYKALYTNQINS